MSDNEIKKAVQEAKNNLEEEKLKQLKDKIKTIIQKLLEDIDVKEKEITKSQKELSILKKDLKDLEAGRLDLIEERQRKDSFAQTTSPIRVINIVERVYEHPKWWHYNVALGANTYSAWSNTDSFSVSTDGNSFKEFSTGTYLLDSGESIDVRPLY